MEQLVDGIAGAHEMQAELTVHPGYPVTINDDDSSRASRCEVATRPRSAPTARDDMPAPVMGAEDFSYVLQQRPGRDGVPRRVPARRAARRARTRATRTA